ncbi:MAG: DUF4238 domain-containing protein [Cytophagaceae bacterium]|nr:MAG: DUF4238 domain-containing protein [Cytophagaceae bacterium]
MAGKRHHFIPQFLQRGFASPSDLHNAWVFPKTRHPFNTNIKNIALEGQFYSNEGDTSVDDKITDEEGALASFLKELLDMEDMADVDPPKAGHLINHSLIRTRHFRQNYQQTSEEIITKLYIALSNPETLIAVMENHIQKEENIAKPVREALVSALGGVLPANKIDEAMKALLPEFIRVAKIELPIQIRRTAKEQANSLKIEGQAFLESPLFKAAMKKGHLKALAQLSTPTPRQLEFSKLKFNIRKFPNGNIILGDSVAVYAVSSERKIAPINDSTTPMTGVLLPLDPDTCLIGTLDEPCDCFSTSARIRESIAACSLEFFIAHKDSSENRQLTAKIGMNSHLLSQNDIDEILRDSLISEILPGSSAN